MGVYLFMEEWKEFIEGYSVSNFGRMRNDKTVHIYKPQQRYKHSNHYSVHIKGKNYSVSREVAKKFVVNDNPEINNVVRHWDGNDENNHYTNLKWGTQKDNTDDSFRHGTHTSLNNAGFKKQQNEKLKPSKVKRKSKSGVKGIQIIKLKSGKIKYRIYLNTTTLGSKYIGSYDTLGQAVEVHSKEYYKLFNELP